MLLDVSDEKTVFQSGLNYKVMQSIIDSWDDRNKRPLGLKSYVETRSLKQDYEFLLINSWEDEHDFLRWHNSEITRWLSSVMPATSPMLSISTSAQGNNI